MAELPQQARVVVIGGGVIGCSIAYHLAKMGWDDVVLLERQQLTSGTTWHAAGLVGQLRNSINMTKLAKYTSELYRGLKRKPVRRPATGNADQYRLPPMMSASKSSSAARQWQKYSTWKLT